MQILGWDKLAVFKPSKSKPTSTIEILTKKSTNDPYIQLYASKINPTIINLSF